MKIRILAASAVLAGSLVVAAIPASADESSAPVPTPAPTEPANPEDLGWGRAGAPTPAPTPASTPTHLASGDLGWG